MCPLGEGCLCSYQEITGVEILSAEKPLLVLLVESDSILIV